MRLGIAAAALLGVGLLAGCHGYARLYPVQGPLAALTPPPVYTAKISLTPNWSKPVTFGAHAQDRMGKISVALANGEQFNGTWNQVYAQPGAANTASDTLASAWDAIYGKGYYTAHVLGAPLFVHTDITGTQGTTLAVEWYELNEGGNNNPRLVARGIAKDSKGDVYKLVF
jgi:hypothetical protein